MEGVIVGKEGGGGIAGENVVLGAQAGPGELQQCQLVVRVVAKSATQRESYDY